MLRCVDDVLPSRCGGFRLYLSYIMYVVITLFLVLFAELYVSYLVNGCVMVLIIVAFLTSEQGSAAKWENGWLAKWPRRLEAEVLEIRSSKGESKERDWKFEEVSGETFWLKV